MGRPPAGRGPVRGPTLFAVDRAGLLELVASEPVVSKLIEAARADSEPTLDVTCPGALRPLVAAALTEQSDTPLLVVTSTYREAESARDTLRSLLGTDAVAYYPAWETLPHERLSPRSDTVGRRLAVLRRLAGNSELAPPRIIVAPVRAVLQLAVVSLVLSIRGHRRVEAKMAEMEEKFEKVIED